MEEIEVRAEVVRGSVVDLVDTEVAFEQRDHKQVVEPCPCLGNDCPTVEAWSRGIHRDFTDVLVAAFIGSEVLTPVLAKPAAGAKDRAWAVVSEANRPAQFVCYSRAGILSYHCPLRRTCLLANRTEHPYYFARKSPRLLF